MDDACVGMGGLPPLAIGGVGGSGTRLVAELVGALGYHLGDDLNHASDNLWFTLLFKRWQILQADDSEFAQLVRALVAAMRGGSPLLHGLEARVRQLTEADHDQHPATWLQARAESLIAAAKGPAHRRPWGWKEPNTHVVIERLWQWLPQLRYIHVVRNGLHMAHSHNQNQLRLWGSHMLGEDGPLTPARALAYWCRVQRRMQQLLVENRKRMYWLDYDALCRDPGPVLADFCRFSGLDIEKSKTLHDLIRQQSSQRASQPIDAFAPEDLDYLRSLGYRNSVNQ